MSQGPKPIESQNNVNELFLKVLKNSEECRLKESRFALKNNCVSVIAGQEIGRSFLNKFKLKRYFEMKKIKAILKESEDELQLHAKEFVRQGKDIQPFQDFLNGFFKELEDEKMGIDLYKGMYTSWMAELPLSMKQKRINEILLPGTHNSGAYKIDFTKHLNSNSKWKWANFAGRYIPFIGGIIREWVITQDSTIFEQLEQGIRVLDLRVSINQSDSEQFVISHSFACIPLEEVLQQILAFMEKHQEEVVVITMKPDWAHRTEIAEYERRMLMQVQRVIGDFLCKKRSRNPCFDCNMTLENMVQHNERILFFYSCRKIKNVCDLNFVWPGKYVNEVWDDTSDKVQKLTCLQKHFKAVKGSERSFNEIPLTLTPQYSDVKRNLWQRLVFSTANQTSIRNMASTMHQELGYILCEHQGALTNFSSVICDFIDRSGLVHQIVQENYRREKREHASAGNIET
mmetsp:Transcript_33267/g.43859  ORF Transcript_33267/g.43859 Transcript_33267/m.43859 type:complete len:458 (+) Transcript_33267:240-1613(+)